MNKKIISVSPSVIEEDSGSHLRRQWKSQQATKPSGGSWAAAFVRSREVILWEESGLDDDT